MRFVRAILLALLGMTSLVQLGEGIASIADPAGMMAGIGLTMTPGVEVPLTFLGLAMIVRGAITAIALWWIVADKPEGLFLARFTALTILLSAPVVYWKLGRPEFAIGDLIQGSLLLVPALMAKRVRAGSHSAGQLHDTNA